MSKYSVEISYFKRFGTLVGNIKSMEQPEIENLAQFVYPSPEEQKELFPKLVDLVNRATVILNKACKDGTGLYNVYGEGYSGEISIMMDYVLNKPVTSCRINMHNWSKDNNNFMRVDLPHTELQPFCHVKYMEYLRNKMPAHYTPAAKAMEMLNSVTR